MVRAALAASLAVAFALIAGTARPAASLGTIGTSGQITFDSGTKSIGYSTQIVNSDGTGTHQFLPTGSEQVVWAPDGQRVAFARLANGQVDVYVMNADGSGLHAVTSSPGNDASPSWAPDGTHLAFDSDRNGEGDIFTVALDGSGEKQITPAGSGEWFPSWSPAGDRIAFEKDGANDGQIWVMNTDGSGAYNASHTAGYNLIPDFSPDGKWIAFESGAAQTDVFIMRVDGTGRTQLTSDAGYDGTPDWSPDGAKIVFHAERPDRDIFTMNKDGTNQARLAGIPANRDWFPDWRPPLCTVKDVVDGDTFDCTDGTRVNMLQIDAPELGACGGDWAKAALQNIFLPPGRKVALAFDTSITDASGAALAAPIWLGDDGTDYNLSIVMAYVGLAHASSIGSGNTKYQAWANASETWAHSAGWNMWAPGKPFVGGC
jgi:endonuclease YncB( thermonuclease family)